MIDAIISLIPSAIEHIKMNWDEHNEFPYEYYHRVINSSSRQMIDVQYSNMKEIVENVYYNIPCDNLIEHYLVKKDRKNRTEHILKLKCKGIPVSDNADYDWYPHESF